MFACSPDSPGWDDGTSPACQRTGWVCVVAGIPGRAGRGPDGVPPTETPLYLPQDVAVAPDGRWWIDDYNNHIVRGVTPQGAMETLVGSGFPGGGDGGPALEEPLDHPTMVLPDPVDPDVLWIAATGNHRIARYTDHDVRIAFPYGTGEARFDGDGGPAAAAAFHRPSSLAFDDAGALYVSDRMNQVVRRIDAEGVIETVLGTPNVAGFGGDGGPPREALLNATAASAMDPGNRLDVRDGRLVVADTGNGRVRSMLLPDGPVSTLLADLAEPHDVALAQDGTVYVADTGAHCVRSLDPEGATHVVAGRCGASGTAERVGRAGAVTFDHPQGLFLDERGFLWIADTQNHVIRRVRVADDG